jgi:hypothetical protein
MAFHARGLINARTIQGNLDWVWPFWIVRQFDPLNNAFVPRSFALTHVNLTNRNWTAVGLPDIPVYPIVDPRGLVTPFYDGWSLDAWILTEEGEEFLPPRRSPAYQREVWDRNTLVVETAFESENMRLSSAVEVTLSEGRPVCRVRYTAGSDMPGVLAVALRPFNPEGVSFVYRVELDSTKRRWRINDTAVVDFDTAMHRHVASEYRLGDVHTGLLQREGSVRQDCEIGMASAAAVYRLPPGTPVTVSLGVALENDPKTAGSPARKRPSASWEEALQGSGRLEIPDERMKHLYHTAVRTLVLLSPLEIYPGPFFYRRFWFRDAVFIIHALLAVGLHERARRAIDHFLSRQAIGGHFESQKGEWDSNGQVLWIFRRFADTTGKPVPERWLHAAGKAADWILKKRLPADSDDYQAGLLPAGFSAEHLGNNDFYYWDDFWAIAGLQAAAELFERASDDRRAERFSKGAEHLALCVERSLLRSRRIRRRDAIPAAPHRRMDAGAVGSIVAGYPLQLLPPREPRLLETLEFLQEKCFIDQAFFQDMIHSGYNIYLTLHCAQCLLRAGDGRFMAMVEKAAELASPTGHWPEAVHPQTLGGCMGDGQHAWAAAEWVMMLHHLFAAEEGDNLMLLRGIPGKWLNDEAPLEIGPLRTRCGDIEVLAKAGNDLVEVRWTARWRTPPAGIVVQIPGTAAVRAEDPRAASGRATLRLPPG